VSVPEGFVFFNSLYLHPVLIRDNCRNIIDYLIKGQDINPRMLPSDDFELLSRSKIVTTAEEDMLVHDRLGRFIRPPQINAACFIVSERCNMRCSYCLADESFCDNINGNVMSEDVAIRGLDFFMRTYHRSGYKIAPSITIYGGEPLISFDVIQVLIERISESIKRLELPEDTTVNINTNGTLLTEDMASFFRDHNVFISISLDGGSRCNSPRVYVDGRDTYEDVLKAVDICRRAGCSFGISSTVTEDVLSNKEEYLDQMESICPSRVGLNPMLSNGCMESGYPERLSEFVLSVVPRLMGMGIIEDRTAEKMYALSNHIVRSHDCYAVRGCQITITPSGKVGTCHGMLDLDEFYVSTVDDDLDPESDPVLRRWTTRSPLLMEVCQKCPALAVCGGGCPMNALRIKGDLFELDDSCCVLSKSLVDWYMRDNVGSFDVIDSDLLGDDNEPV